MGQMTYAVMLGAEQTPPESLEEGWYDMTSCYKPGRGGMQPDTPHGDGNHDVLGFWIAVGASGRRGVPDMPESIALNDFASEEPWKEQIEKARAAWSRLVTFAATKGIVLPADAQLYLVQTEVA